ncbi:unnamed protein product [Gordionus sp. m RMFG-2023]
MNVRNESFLRFNQTELSYKLSTLETFYFEFAIPIIAVHGMLGNIFSLTFLMRFKRTNSYFLLVLLRLINITLLCINFSDLFTWIGSEIIIRYENTYFIFIWFTLIFYILESLAKTLKVFHILMIMALCVERYFMIGYFQCHRIYYVAANIKYVVTLLIIISVSIMFPVYTNYIRASVDLFAFKHNITGQKHVRNYLLPLIHIYNHSDNKYDACTNIVFQAIFIIVLVCYLTIRYYSHPPNV